MFCLERSHSSGGERLSNIVGSVVEMKIEDLCPYLTVRQAAEILRLTPWTVSTYARAGRFSGTLRGGPDGTAYLIPRRSVVGLVGVEPWEEEL